MKPDREWLGISPSEAEVLDAIGEAGESGISQVVNAQRHWRAVYSTLVKTHPGHLLTIRNTRGALSGLGYTFPERRFDAPSLSIDASVADFYSMADEYLDSTFGRVEAAQHPEKANALGFMKSTYRQRLASSLRAAELTLGRRLARIEGILQGVPAAGPVDDDEMDSEAEGGEDLVVADGTTTSAMLEHACRVELGYLHDLTRQLEDLDVEDLGTDPKLDMVMDLIERHLARGDQILVFSRYTDTVDACVALFLDRNLGHAPPPHAKYTGSASWIDTGDGPLPVDKEEIRRALDEAEISIIFCSDAASEGLNLQGARVIVNVDVPWNPARLEQRIGRIARLGQRAPEVDIYNLWYPDSVEAKIYERLLQRRDLYELAVGEFPEIVGSAIRNELSARYATGAAAISDDPLQVLQSLRENQQRLAIQRIWKVELSDRPESQRFRERLADIVRRATDSIGVPRFSVAAGERDALTLLHPALDMVSTASPELQPGSPRLSVVLEGSVPIGFVFEEESEFVVIPAEELPSLIGWLALGDQIGADPAWIRVPRSSTDLLVETIRMNSLWTPRSNDLLCVVPGGLDRTSFTDRHGSTQKISVAQLNEATL